LPSLTGLRGVAALWVVSHHVLLYLPGVRFAPAELGYLGVDVFFLLSGFIIAYVHLQDFPTLSLARIGDFLSLRLSRIYPVHFVMLLAEILNAIGLSFFGISVLGNPRYEPRLLVANLLLVQAWGWTDETGFNSVSWSISAEWLGYLAFPFLALVVARFSARIAIGVAVIAIAAEVAAFLIIGVPNMDQAALYAPLRIAGEFTCGMCLHAIFRRGDQKFRHSGAVADLAFAALILCVAFRQSFLAVLCMPLIVLGLAYGRGRLAKILAAPALVYVGEISYSLYMVHRFTMGIVFTPFAMTPLAHSLPAVARNSVLVLSLVAVAGVAYLMHEYVEMPARSWLRARLAPRAAAY
jgi:peptidoglycan/LPS O-acetylase OafA/YrhL